MSLMSINAYRVMIVFRRHTRFLQRLLHDIRIIPQRIKFAGREVHGREILVVVRREEGEDCWVVGVDFHMSIGTAISFMPEREVSEWRKGKTYS